jgi:hypothetical protein
MELLEDILCSSYLILDKINKYLRCQITLSYGIREGMIYNVVNEKKLFLREFCTILYREFPQAHIPGILYTSAHAVRSDTKYCVIFFKLPMAVPL